MNNKLEELKKDFNHLLSMVDFENYNPSSPNVQKLINVGLLWYLCDELEEEHEDKVEDIYDHAKDELKDAEKYFLMYESERNPSLKNIAHQELQHASFFLNQLKLSSKTVKEQAMYNSLQEWHNHILEKINR